MGGVQARDLGIPLGDEPVVADRSQTRGFKLSEQVLARIVRKADIAGDKSLIQNRRTEEVRELLFLNRIARVGQRMPKSRKNQSGDVSLERLKEGKSPLGERQNHISLAQLDMILRGNRKFGMRIEPEGIECRQELPGRRLRKSTGRH